MKPTTLACAAFTVGVRAQECTEQFAEANPEWTRLRRTGKCYGIFESGTQYHCELAVCRPRNASLACVNSDDTDFALADLIADYDGHREKSRQVWMGKYSKA